jgi:hypothetical protein
VYYLTHFIDSGLQETKRVLEKLAIEINSKSEALAKEKTSIEDEANRAAKSINSAIVSGYVNIGECVTAVQKWTALWPALKLWLSNEAAAVESMYSSADVLGLLGELQELKRYIKLAQVSCILLLAVYSSVT